MTPFNIIHHGRLYWLSFHYTFPIFMGGLKKILLSMSWCSTYGVHLSAWWMMVLYCVFSSAPWPRVLLSHTLNFHAFHFMIFHLYEWPSWPIFNSLSITKLELNSWCSCVRVFPHISLIISMNGDDSIGSSKLKFYINFSHICFLSPCFPISPRMPQCQDS